MKYILLLLAAVVINEICISQDVKFSQYFASPLTINPALCGVYAGQYRMMGNYRNQWQQIQYPYTTATASAEMQLQGKDFEDDILAVGFYALTDRSNNGGLRNNTFSGTVSYHKALDEEGISRIGAGIQVAYVSKIVDYSKMTFETQFTPIGYDISLPTNESSTGLSSNYLDYSAGVMYSYLAGDFNFYGGASASHLTQPRETYGSYSTRLPMRLTFHAGASLQVGEINTLYCSLIHMQTPQSNQTTFGLVYGLNMNGGDENDANEFLVGTWVRFKDAIVPYLGLKIGNVQGGLSYDITTSNVTAANKGMGGLELSLQIILDRDPNKQTQTQVKCKRVMY